MLKPKISDKKYYQQSLTLCKLQWILKFKVEISSYPLTSISASFIGDFFVSLYPRHFCIWSKAAGKRFESLFCCHSQHDCPGVTKHSAKVSTEGYCSAEVSTDGRLVVVRSVEGVKVWYNRVYQAGREGEVAERFELASFALEHQSEVIACEVKKQDFFETIAKYIPNLIVTITKDFGVHLWLENFGQNNIEFFCFESIMEFSLSQVHPRFSFARSNTKERVYNCPKEDVIQSKLLAPHRDKVFQLLKKHNEMGIRKRNYPSDSNDWLCFITVFSGE